MIGSPEAESLPLPALAPIDVLDSVGKAQAMTGRALWRVVYGGVAGVISTPLAPAHLEVTPGVDAEVSVLANTTGIVATATDGRLNAPKATDLPVGLHLSFNSKAESQASIKAITAVAGNPGALGDSTLEALTLRAGETGLATAILLPVMIGATIQMRRHRREHRDKEAKRFRRPRAILAPLLGAATIAACGVGVGGVQAVQEAGPSDFNDKPVLIEELIGSKDPKLHGATVQGRALTKRVREAIADKRASKVYWHTADDNLKAVLATLEQDGALAEILDDQYISELIISSPQCRPYFPETVLRTLEKALKPETNTLLGDLLLSGGRSRLEDGCQAEILGNLSKEADLIGVQGNHDDPAEPLRTDIDGIKTLENGMTFAGNRDFRLEGPPVNPDDPSKEVALQGSRVAKLACDYFARTGRRLRVLVHVLQAGFETILRGCASKVDSDHAVATKGNTEAAPDAPSLEAIRSLDGRVTIQEVSRSATAATAHKSPLGKPEHPAALILNQYSRDGDNELIRSWAIIFDPEGLVKIEEMELPKPINPPLEMIKFVKENSPTAATLPKTLRQQRHHRGSDHQSRKRRIGQGQRLFVRR